MTIETFLVKRKSRYTGEVGLFSNSQLSEDDFAAVPIDTEVRVEMATERNMQMLKFVWALAGMIANNTDYFLDSDDAMNGPQGLKIKARHCKIVVDKETREIQVRPLSLKRLSNEAFHRLLKRMVFVVCTDLIPGMDEGPLRDEIEKMIAGKQAEPDTPPEEPPPHDHHPRG